MAKKKIDKKNSRLLRVEKQINEAAEIAGIKKELAFTLIEDFFERIEALLKDPRKPTISIRGFGNFYVRTNQLKNYFSRRIRAFKKSKQPRYTVEKFIKKFWPIYKRRKSEKRTYKQSHILDWNNIDGEYLKKLEEGIHTKLPSNYFNLKGLDFLSFLREEPRYLYFIKDTARGLWEYNSLIGASHLDKNLAPPPVERFSEKEISYYFKRCAKPRLIAEKVKEVKIYFSELKEQIT